MFPIIPMLRQPTNQSRVSLDQLWSGMWSSEINKSVIKSEAATKCENTKFGVIASDFLPKNAISSSISVLHLGHPIGNLDKLIQIGMSSRSGQLKCREKTFFKHIRLADDVHSNNAILETTPERQLRIRISRDVIAGDELQLWFSEEIQALMYIPFLTPANIRNKTAYTCHICDRTFETPNPLKIHIATSCDSRSMESLWTTVQHSLRPQYPTPPPPTISPPLPCQLNRVSAFRRVAPISPENTQQSLFSSSSMQQLHHQSPEEAAAHLETIASNMGTSKQGHLCIYCGKVYSRKYGLKIHIRTHTGFKPLKCKFCARPFGDPSNLNKHVRLHVQATNSNYKCNECGKVLMRRRDLLRHIQSRHQGGQVIYPMSSSSSSSCSEDIVMDDV